MEDVDRVLVSQGAEARLCASTFLQRPVVIKQRFKKGYRTAELDTKLTQSRIKQESRGLIRARKLGVRTPVLFFVDYPNASLYLEKIEGQTVKEILCGMPLDKTRCSEIFTQIGKAVAALHDGNLNHGDLTTSNMIVREDGNLVLIDFGLSYTSHETEDKAVDLYVMERAITSAHAELSDAFDQILEAYRKATRHWSKVYPKYTTVRMRGRKRLMIG